MKDSFYFQHDYNARNDECILELRAEFGLSGYALYFMLLESMAESRDGFLNRSAMAGLSLSYGSAIEELKAIVQRSIDLKLFFESDGRFSSRRMLEYKEFRKERAESGRKGAVNRWGDSSAIAVAIAESNAKDRIGKDSIKKKENVKEQFRKPATEEIKSYCEKRKNGIDAEIFWNFYESKGWKVGNSPMVSWKAAIITWEKNKKEKEGVGKKPIKFRTFTQDDL